MIKNPRSNYRRKTRKSYFPFQKGMRGQIFTNGANYQLNLQQKQGVLEKIKQSAFKALINNFDSIVYITGHQLTDGTYQALIFGLDGSDIKLRVIEPDGTITTPTSGAGDLVFSGLVTSRQVNENTLISYSGGARTWNGTEIGNNNIATETLTGSITGILDYSGTIAGTVILTSIEHGLKTGETITITGTTNYNGDYVVTVTSANDFYITETFTSNQTGSWSYLNNFNIISTARDGSRLAFIDNNGKPRFTDNNPSNGFSGATGANASGDYNCGLSVSTAVIEGGAGVVIFGRNGAEAHWVQPNNASDEVSSRTKIESFNYQGTGVINERFVCSTGSSIIFMNKDGVFEMNPFTGQSVNLVDDGKIKRYWDEQIDIEFGFVSYDPETDTIIAQVSLNSPQNNTLICFARREGNPPYFIDNHYLAHIGNVGGGLVGGSNSTGETFNLFMGYSITEGGTGKARYVTEFDGLGQVHEEKTLYSVTAVLGVSPTANVKVRAYFDNELSASFEKTYTPQDLTTLNEDAVYGEYVFALGAVDLVQERIINGQNVKANSRFSTIAIEIIEESDANFEIYDIILEYKRTGRLSKTISLKNNLF